MPFMNEDGPAEPLAVASMCRYVEVGRLELRPASRHAACSRPHLVAHLRFLAAHRDR